MAESVAVTIRMDFQDKGNIAMSAEVDDKALMTAGELGGLGGVAECRGDVGKLAGKWLDKILLAKQAQIRQKLTDQVAKLEQAKAALDSLK